MSLLTVQRRPHTYTSGFSLSLFALSPLFLFHLGRRGGGEKKENGVEEKGMEEGVRSCRGKREREEERKI